MRQRQWAGMVARGLVRLLPALIIAVAPLATATAIAQPEQPSADEAADLASLISLVHQSGRKAEQEVQAALEEISGMGEQISDEAYKSLFEAIAANNLHELVEYLIAEAQASGVAEQRIIRAIGDSEALAALPVVKRQQAVRRLESEILRQADPDNPVYEAIDALEQVLALRIQEAHGLGLSQQAIMDAIGSFDDHAGLPAEQRERAIRRLEAEILREQGFEIVEPVTGTAVRRTAARALAGTTDEEDLALLRRIVESAEGQGMDPFARLAAQGVMNHADGFNLLLTNEEILVLWQLAIDAELVPVPQPEPEDD